MATFTKVCFYCKQEFEASHPLANICSPDCRSRTTRSRAGQLTQPVKPMRGAVTHTRTVDSGRNIAASEPEPCGTGVWCPRCRNVFEDATGTRKYCSPACRRAIRRKRRKEAIRRAYVEPVSIAVLRQRDKGQCGICGKPVDFTTQPPSPLAATIDHVIALVRGGEHSYGNTQLAHHRCNTQKGAG